MKINVENTQKYTGPIEKAPGWAVRLVMPRYRRFLVHPLFVSVVATTGITVGNTADSLVYWILALPSYGLLLEMAEIARTKAIERAFREDKRTVEKEDL